VPHNCSMRKKVVLLAVSALFLAIITPLANAAVKPGTKCTKLGQTSTSTGIKYTCIKSGKKLVWNKGVAVKKPAPTPTPTPSATATPEATATPSATPTPSATATPSPEATATPSATPTPTQAPTQQATVTPGAFCTPAGAVGQSSSGVLYTCKTSATDTRNRWRQ